MNIRHFITLALVAAAPAHAQDLRPAMPTIETKAPKGARQEFSKSDAAFVRTLAGRFFMALKDGNVDRAYEELTRGSKLASKTGEIEALKQQTLKATAMFGPVKGHELISTEPVGSHLVRTTYLSLGENYPLRWRFYFYESGGTWRLIDIRVDDSLVRMFDESEDEGK